MELHPDDFIPFLPSMGGEDAQGAGDPGMITPQEFVRYCAIVRGSSQWGGEPEITALSRAYNVPIRVVQAGAPNVVDHDPNGSSVVNDNKYIVHVSYHRYMYGLGEVGRNLVH